MTDKATLNSVQHFTGRVILGQSQVSRIQPQTLNRHPLETRRKLMKFKICYTIYIPLCIPPPPPDSQIIFIPLVTSLAYRFSLFL